jgi:CRP-like cAMP-binding protein
VTHSALMAKKLESIGVDLTGDERAAIAAIPCNIQHLKANQDFVREGDRPTRTCMVIDGLACRYSNGEGGKRQIMSFHIPGDIPDLHSLFIRVMDHSLCALSDTTIASITHKVMLDFIDRHPRIGRAFWRDTLIDAAVFREWMVGIGRRSAYSRIAHLFCEMLLRMQAVELADGNTCSFAASQAEIADALGLSTVHVNRTLQELRGARLVAFEGGKLNVLDLEGLKAAGEFDPTYLHLDGYSEAA